MKSVRVTQEHKHFVVANIDTPNVPDGHAVVGMQAALLAPYMAALPVGEWMTPPTPFTPGQCAVGVVEQAADDLRVGQKVYFDAYVGSNDPNDCAQNHGFIGCFAVAPGARAALAANPNGSFAEKIIAPATHFTPIPDNIEIPASVLCRLGWFGTALAGLERGGFRAGMTLAINGATGIVGAGAVLLALALGADKIRVFGRNKIALKQLVALDPTRIEIGDAEAIDPIDMLLECSGGDQTSVSEMLVGRLNRYGNAVFVGALTTPLNVDAAALMRNSNSLIGSFWFTPNTFTKLLGIIQLGALDVSPLSATIFELNDIQNAVSFNQTQSLGGLHHTVLVPSKANI